MCHCVFATPEAKLRSPPSLLTQLWLPVQPHHHGEIQVEPNPACIADTQVQVVTLRPTAAAGSGAEFIVSQNTVKNKMWLKFSK